MGDEGKSWEEEVSGERVGESWEDVVKANPPADASAEEAAEEESDE
jgi:hypothetical protein